MTGPSAAPTIRAVRDTAHLDAALIAAGREVETLAVEIEALRALWPKGETAVKRAEIGRRLESAYDRLAELYGVIASTDAHTLAGAAVKLRRAIAAVEAHDCGSAVDRDREPELRLIESALAVVENCAAR